MTDAKREKVSFWKERNMLKLARDHPLGVVLLLIVSILFWFVLVGPLLDEAESESRGSQVTQVRLASADMNAAPDRPRTLATAL